MRICKVCNSKLVYHTIQNSGRVSTYKCSNEKCARIVDIPFKDLTAADDREKKFENCTRWFVKKMEGLNNARKYLDLYEQEQKELEIEDEDEG